MWGRGPAQRKQILKKIKNLKLKVNNDCKEKTTFLRSESDRPAFICQNSWRASTTATDKKIVKK
jgi:hypothetical protein